MVTAQKHEIHHVRVITNPMAGKDRPVLGALASAFDGTGIQWDLDVTNESGQAADLARKAIEDGADLVVAFGGDGTVSEVADAVADHDGVLFGILPGGTGNAFARELGIPLGLEEAAKLLAGEHEVRTVDLGVAEFKDGGRWSFILRVSVGLEATAVIESPREAKEKLGELAYIIAAVRKLPERPVAHYKLSAPDGREVELDGLFGVLTNSGHVGVAEFRYAPDILVDDGLLDGLIAPATVPELVNAAATAFSGGQSELVERLTAEELYLVCDPPQPVTVDGEVRGDTPVRVKVRPGALKVIAPVRSEGNDTSATR